MKISRISLFVLGNSGGEFADEGKRVRYSAAELMKDIKDGVGQLCELGSEEAACFTVFDGQFRPGLDAAIGGVRANPRAITAGVQATQLYAIYLINSARSEQEWARCIRETADSVRNLAFTQISHIAIVQKDGLRINDPELVEALETVNAAVYLFSQSTRAGWVLASANEERKLLSNYAILAACGMLPDTYGLYTGTFNKLSLMKEDFRRIRVHYAVKALTTRARGDQSLNEDALFTAFFGGWPPTARATPPRWAGSSSAWSSRCSPTGWTPRSWPTPSSAPPTRTSSASSRSTSRAAGCARCWPASMTSP